MTEPIRKSDQEWQRQLTPEQYNITRRKDTEPPFTGKYYRNKDAGMYRCICCAADLYSSEAKYDSGSGWPSFWAPVGEEKIEYARDASHGMERIEILCSRCGSHLGHVFDDGPKPTGKRHCVNSASLDFVKKNP